MRGAEREGTRCRSRMGTIPAGAGSSGHVRTAGGDGEGPSPRVRGAAPDLVPEQGAGGTIPAGAGSSSRGRPRNDPRWDHPRGCGEQQARYAALGRNAGPSPRVRGAGARTRPAPPPKGTIPAGAGSSGRYRALAPERRDHPRGCGEQLISFECGGWWWGPSPRVRGAALVEELADAALGTIPAGAGSSFSSSASTSKDRDHPRGCGEQCWFPLRRARGAGPSPRVRGAESAGCGSRSSTGTIPAGAGSSGDLCPGAADLEGPSPRVRGAGLKPPKLDSKIGTIPAGAGSRALRLASGKVRGDHPRGCGEQCISSRSTVNR
ncbi:hypothetical protein D3C57_109120 [Streptomyces rapamycinicus NRRL 5491]|uniref:Uncharacterized protein n=1 Tax=Streptomyces rapamycinicus (strain ATCC 29253 / DSM 41530 / NRRL 5491 / AYB-994) TaxID=1343740 RepID=A0A3L8RG16_STRRN|nr:hypothetical protein D3C57_109120 [Streptomyces rapamycinicus NRRL 5491]